MKLLLFAIAPLFVANFCFSMELQRTKKKIVTETQMAKIFETWKPKFVQRDPEREQVFTELMSEYDKTEDLQRVSKKQTDLLKLLAHSLDAIKDFPSDEEYLHALIDTQDSLERHFQVNLGKGLETDPISVDFLAAIKTSNRERENDLRQNRALIVSFLNDKRATQWIDDAGSKKAITAMPTISATNVAMPELQLKILADTQQAFNKKHAQLKNCLSCMKQYLQSNSASAPQLIEAFELRIKAFSQLNKKSATIKSNLELVLANQKQQAAPQPKKLPQASKREKVSRNRLRRRLYTCMKKVENSEIDKKDALVLPSVPEEDPSADDSPQENYLFRDSDSTNQSSDEDPDPATDEISPR